jgi:hypothetical protein
MSKQVSGDLKCFTLKRIHTLITAEMISRPAE